MITFNPPVSKSYAPSTQQIASVTINENRMEKIGRSNVSIELWDQNGARVSMDPAFQSSARPTPDQLTAFASCPSLVGDTQDQRNSRAALPILSANYGLTGGSVV